MADLSQYSNEELMQLLQSIQKPKPTTEQKIQASVPGRVVQGMRDPIDAGAQLATHVLPNSAVDAVNSGTQYLNDLPYLGAAMKAVGMTPATTEQIDSGISKNERDYQAARAATGSEGVDFARFGGNVVSPANLAISRLIPVGPAASLAAKAGKGSLLGATGAAMQPVNDVDEGKSFGGTKALQMGFGAIGGAVLTPVMSRLGDVLARKINVFRADPEITGARASLATDQVINDALKEIGQTVDDIPSATMMQLRQQVQGAMMQGKKLDPAALLRDKDFKDAGIPSLLGQITRDPTQFAREKNLRGVANVGEPLMQRFDQQNQLLQRGVGAYGKGAKESFQAGEDISNTLAKWDDVMRGRVSDEYKIGRASTGKDLEIPLKGLAQDYAQTLRDFGEANIPGAVRARLNELGLLNGKQTKVFSAQDAEELLQVINKNYDPTKKAERGALDSLRGAIKNAILSADDQGGAFAPARAAAKMRFDLHDAVPALRAASDGTVAADDFVKRFVLNGKTVDVQMLAQLLSETDPTAFQEARKQIGAKLQKAAFGNNTTGDKLFAADRYAEELSKFGTDKLKAFYSTEEIDAMRRLSRVGAYINSTPSAAAVNTSNTAAAQASLLGKIPGVSPMVSLAAAIKNTVDNQNVVRRAMAAQPPTAKADLTPEQIRMLAQYLSAGAGGAGAATAEPLR